MVESGKLLRFVLKVICQFCCRHYSTIHINELLVRIVLLIYEDKEHDYQMLLKCLYQKC